MDKIIKDFLNRLRQADQNREPAPGQEKEWKELENIWQWSADYRKDSPKIDLESNLQRFKKRIRQEKAPRKFILRRNLLAVAAAILLLLTGAWLFRQPFLSGSSEIIMVEHTDKKPQSLELSDGSRVTLYEGARLEYPKQFSPESTREVVLEGQANFDVRSRPGQSFVVSTPHTSIEVLGTRFLVRDHAEGAKSLVQVEEGKVRFVDEDSGASLILYAAEMGICQTGGYLSKRSVTPGRQVSTQTTFRARGRSLSQMVAHWEWWTDLTFTVSPMAADCPLSSDFDFTRSEEILEELKLLGFTVEKTGDLHYQIDGACQGPGR